MIDLDYKIEALVKRKEILQALNFASGVVEKRNIKPILGNILISAEENKLKILATSLDISLSIEIGAEIHYQGETTVNIVTFSDIIRKLNDENISLKFESSKALLYVIGKNFSSNLQTLPASEFPSIDNIEEGSKFIISAKKLLRIIINSEFAMSNEETRYNLNGIFLNNIGNGVLNSTAIDGHRLATSSEICENLNNFGMIIPKKTVAEFIKILKEYNNDETSVEISYDDHRIQLKINNIIITSKLIDATFPDYKNLIPELSAAPISTNAKILSESVDRVSTITNDKFKAVKLKISKENIEISAFGESKGSAIEVIENNNGENFSYDGENLIFGFNPNYLLDVLKRIEDDEIEIFVENSESPIIVKSIKYDSDRFIIMPIKV